MPTAAMAAPVGAGSAEFRIQTQQAFSGGLIAVAPAGTGVTYDKDDKTLTVRLAGGTGYFVSDPLDSKDGKLVFNRTVTLRDTWAKIKDK